MSDKAEVEGGGATAEVAIKAVTNDVLAGGPLEIEMSVSVRGDQPAYLAVGGDRVRRRPQGITLDAMLEGSGAKAVDPSDSMPDLGGPLGVAELTPKAPLRRVLLANAFLTLEHFRQALEPGASGIIRLGCVCELRLASEQAGAPAAKAVRAPRLELRVPVRRDDAALEQLFARIAHEAAAVKDLSARQRAVDILSTARDPAASKYLATLTSQPG